VEELLKNATPEEFSVVMERIAANEDAPWHLQDFQEMCVKLFR
jgi:hypothetical protein